MDNIVVYHVEELPDIRIYYSNIEYNQNDEHINRICTGTVTPIISPHLDVSADVPWGGVVGGQQEVVEGDRVGRLVACGANAPL